MESSITRTYCHMNHDLAALDQAGVVQSLVASCQQGSERDSYHYDKDIGWEIAFGQMPAPQPVTLALTRELERIVLSVPSEPGRLYTLKSSNDFRQWIVSGEQSGDGQALEWTFPIREAHRFWRVEVR